LLAFLLGQLVKDKARFYQLQRHQQPELVTVKLSELEERVCGFAVIRQMMSNKLCFCISQAKEHDIFDTAPFLRSKLFSTNGYKLNDGVIQKSFKMD
jgi:DNA replication licensing factor MCM2